MSVCGPSDFDLTLLRNDDLPRKVLPTTYNFAAYNEALLDPKGLVDRDEPGNVLMCERCHRDLVVKRRMPRLCLANWLYYGHEELPAGPKAAFAAGFLTGLRSSRLGKGAIIQGRRILTIAATRRLEASALPPPPEMVRDTVCAVYVAKARPTKDNIGRLGPILVRKSRMLTMIQFLVGDNPHYACDTEFHGFSQRNLDSLFGIGTDSQDEGVPCALDVGFIEDSIATRSSMSGYADQQPRETDDYPVHTGGFHEPGRRIPITMEEQLKYLLELDDNRFERDPDFAFVYYNILQKKAVCESELLSTDKDELGRLITSFKSNQRFEATTPEQEMRDMMAESTQYKADLFAWLESLIKCELLGTSMVVKESIGRQQRPNLNRLPGYVDPGTTLGPRIQDVTQSKFALQFASDVNDLVTNTNWHQHTDTCWKYLSPREPRTDESCRMRIDGSTQEHTYNDVIIFLLRANMEIKHISSGERAKALIYYVTDYITKASLPAHAGLAALLYAINRTHEKQEKQPDWGRTNETTALTMLVNGMMARQEIPHQQVMSYLLGGGDCYKSDKFRVLHYGSFERLVLRYWKNDEDTTAAADGAQYVPDAADIPVHQHPTGDGLFSTAGSSRPVESLQGDDESVTLILGAGRISAVNQQQDYLFRPRDEPFDSMSLYEYTGMTEKVTKSGENRRVSRRQDDGSGAVSRGRPEEPRVWVVPVVLGDKIPRPDRGVEERERWARTILTLFIPWRHPRDLRDEGQTWYAAYESRAHHIKPDHMRIVHNMNVLTECKEARDKANLAFKMAQRAAPVMNAIPSHANSVDAYSDRTPLNGGDLDVVAEQLSTENTLIRELDKEIGTRFRHAIDAQFSQQSSVPHPVEQYGAALVLTEDKRAEVAADRAHMRLLKRKRRPEEPEHDPTGAEDRNVRPRTNPDPLIDTIILTDGDSSQQRPPVGNVGFDSEDLIAQWPVMLSAVGPSS
uniref:AGC/PDK1 protein kinase n=1 Tax=Ganoderma boninense TaxID=34458 RepID=A0A5K1K246_9APHY|nr:AGC/PDK1 protein kinase [Ganoderma boninense]